MQIFVQGERVAQLRSRKALSVLALLTLRQGKIVQRDWIAGCLWPDADSEQALTNLRPVLSELKRALGAHAGRICSPNRSCLKLDLSEGEADVVEFDAAIKTGELPALERAISLYCGPLLEDVGDDWILQERNAREQDCLLALHTLADSCLSSRDYRTAAEYYRRAIALDPWRDAARRGLMDALARDGDSNAALHEYREFVDFLRSDPRAAPDDSTKALYEKLRAEAKQRMARPTLQKLLPLSLPEPAEISGYIPHPLTDLIGREDELSDVVALLRRSRLVTLTGIGGIGKTRLAIAVAQDSIPVFADGVRLVSLEALTDGAEVAAHIATTLGLRDDGSVPSERTLTEYLRDKRMLLVIDNCEHLLASSAEVAMQILRTCAGVRILATSREALGIVGEQQWPVPELAVPVPEHLPKGQSTRIRVLLGFESVRLFVERAQTVKNDFTLTGENSYVVAEICSKLEGIPLAIELAAARVRAMTVEQIADRLSDHLGLLSHGRQTENVRQQTLRAALNWSYALLTESERQLFGRLSVFAGGWTLEAAEKVCSFDGVDEASVLDILTSLVDKSLVTFDALSSNSQGRYRLLETVRQYASDCLNKSGAANLSHERHGTWAVDLAELAYPHLSTSDQGKWHATLSIEHDNLRAALDWSSSISGGDTIGLRLVAALWPFWLIRGYGADGLRYTRQILTRKASNPLSLERAKALMGAGVLTCSQGDYASGRTYFEESLDIFRKLDNKNGIASALNALGNAAHALGEYTKAWAAYEESLAIIREQGDDNSLAGALHNLGNMAHSQGDFEHARSLYEEGLTIVRKLNNKHTIATTLRNLGNLVYAQGEFDLAKKMYEESLTLFRDQEDKQHIALLLEDFGDVAYASCDYVRAGELYQQSLTIRTELQDRRGGATSLHNLGNVAFALGEPRQANELYRKSLPMFNELGFLEGVVRSLKALAAVMLIQERRQKAVRLWRAAHDLREKIGMPNASVERDRLDQSLNLSRTILDEAAFTTAWTEGGDLSLDQAIAYALDEAAN